MVFCAINIKNNLISLFNFSIFKAFQILGLIMEITRNPQLQIAFDFVQSTNKNIFLTGKAGTGKTTFLHNLKKKSLKRMVVVAPTGVAAINAGGVTIHSFFQMPFGPHIPNKLCNVNAPSDNNRATNNFKKFNREKINIIKTLDLLVIDEISMVRADLLDGLDEVLRRYKDRSLPFGGVQLLMIGDIQQLAPVIKDDEWEILKDHYETVFFFSSMALQKTSYVSIELKHIYRQNDQAFIKLLNKIRDNSMDIETLHELNKRYKPGFSQEEESDGYIILTTHNAQAQEINDSKLKKLPGNSHIFKASVQGDFPEYSYPTEFELALKKGAQVMFVKNDSSHDKLYYNGKIGAIVKFEDDIVFVKCKEDPGIIALERVEWQNMKYTIDKETKEIKEEIAGTFVQYPLKLAWAITIHKSQGLTFDKAIIDAKAAFAHGQVYVALSRCRTLDGLVLNSPISQKCVISNSTVSHFSKEIEQNPPGDKLLNESKKTYQQMLLMELFNFIPVQRQISYLIKVVRENSGSIFGNLQEKLLQLNSSIKTDIIEVFEKFDKQLQQLIKQEDNIENNLALQERVKKACAYFAEKTEEQVENELSPVKFETDNTEVRKTIKKLLERLHEELKIKIYCLKECRNGFYVRDYLETRAKAALQKPTSKKDESKTIEEYAPADLPHQELYRQLKNWRNSKASELNLPSYMVLPWKTVAELLYNLPTSTAGLKKIKGIGKKKIETFGYEILEIIDSYCKENNIEPPEVVPFSSPKKQKKNTKQISFELLKSGKTIKEIADEREMSPRTIEGHLAYFIGTGELNIEEFVAPDKINHISNYFLNSNNTLLAPAKSALGENVSYSELLFVIKHLEYMGKVDVS